MKICEACGGNGTHSRTFEKPQRRRLCPPCQGTGIISLGPEGTERWNAKRRAVLEGALVNGDLQYVRVEPRGWAWQPVTQADLDAAL